MFRFTVAGQTVTLETPAVVADSVNYLTAEVAFSADWIGYQKTAIFRQGNNVLKVILDQYDGIDASKGINLTFGVWEVSFVGIKGGSTITTNSVNINVAKSGLRGGVPFEVTASEVTLLIGQLNENIARQDASINTNFENIRNDVDGRIGALKKDIDDANSNIFNYVGIGFFDAVQGNFSGNNIESESGNNTIMRTEIITNLPAGRYEIIGEYEFNLYAGDTTTTVAKITSDYSTFVVTDVSYPYARFRIARKDGGTVPDRVENILKYAESKSLETRIGNIDSSKLEFVRGAISNASGTDVVSSTYVRTPNFFKIDSIIDSYVPAEYGMFMFLYSSDNTDGYIVRSNIVTPTSSDRSIDVGFIKQNYPNAVYARATIYKNGTPVIDVGEIIGAGCYIKVIVDVRETIDALENDRKQYINISDAKITSDTTYTVVAGSERNKNMIVTVESMYSCAASVTDVPTIHARRSSVNYQGNMAEYYGSSVYAIGKRGQYSTMQFRLPPYQQSSGDLSLDIKVPAGVTLFIRNLYNKYDDFVSRENCGITLYAHGYSGGSYPAQTLAQFEGAARLGYRYCITIPKVTKDGVYVCLHDDDSIQATARNTDGTRIDSQYMDRPVSDFTYSELLQFDFGISRGIDFKGYKIPLLEDFFKVCARTGMHPVLSVHPSLSGHWENIKAMAKKYNVLDKLGVKSDPNILSIPMAVLGNDIESYTSDQSTTDNYIQTFTNLLNTYSIDRNKVKCVMEYHNDIINDTFINETLISGFYVGCYNYGNDSMFVKHLIEKGVTEFTEDYNASVGLNW